MDSTEENTFSGEAHDLRKAAAEYAQISSKPENEVEIKVVDESLLPSRTDPGGKNLGVDVKTASDALSKYHEQQRAEREDFERALQGEEPDEAPSDQTSELQAELRDAYERMAREEAEGIQQQHAQQQAQQVVQGVEHVRGALIQQLASAFPEFPHLIQNPQAFAELQRSDPYRAQEIEQGVRYAENQFAQVTQSAQIQHAHAQQAQQIQFQQWANQEDTKFAKENTAILDEAGSVKPEVRRGVWNWLTNDLGFSEQDLAEAYRSTSLRSAKRAYKHAYADAHAVITQE